MPVWYPSRGTGTRPAATSWAADSAGGSSGGPAAMSFLLRVGAVVPGVTATEPRKRGYRVRTAEKAQFVHGGDRPPLLALESSSVSAPEGATLRKSGTLGDRDVRGSEVRSAATSARRMEFSGGHSEHRQLSSTCRSGPGWTLRVPGGRPVGHGRRQGSLRVLLEPSAYTLLQVSAGFTAEDRHPGAFGIIRLRAG